MATDYITTLLPKYINDVKSLYNLLFLSKSVYNKSLKITERIKKRYTLEPYARAKVVYIDCTEEDKIHIKNKFPKRKELSDRYVKYVLQYVNKKYLYIAENNFKKSDILVIKYLFTDLQDLDDKYDYGYFIYDGDEFQYFTDYDDEIGSFSKDINSIISCNEYNPSYYDDIGYPYSILSIDIYLYLYKDTIIKNLIINTEHNFGESYWQDGTIIFYLHEMYGDEKIDKNCIIKYISEIQENCVWSGFNHYHDELKQYLTYKKDNVIWISTPTPQDYEDRDNPYISD